MDFTFGIITCGTNDIYIEEIIKSIKSENIPNYEIIIVGNTTIKGNNIININFNENIKPAWITKKKNIICQYAKYENIVLLHDYIKLCSGWYNGFLLFGNNFNICCNKIITLTNKRFRDLTMHPCLIDNKYKDNCLLPYNLSYEQLVILNKYTYISGSYYVIKKHIALQYPLNELLIWGQGEDMELNERLIRNNIVKTFNTYSVVQIIKNKDQCIWEEVISNNYLNELLQI